MEILGGESMGGRIDDMGHTPHGDSEGQITGHGASRTNHTSAIVESRMVAASKLCPLAELIVVIRDLVTAIEKATRVLEQIDLAKLGGGHKPLYKAAPLQEAGILDEAQMASMLSIPKKTLGNYRRQGKLPGCWLRNGKHTLWRVEPTLTAWKQGLP